jgi:hypothetical protein
MISFSDAPEGGKSLRQVDQIRLVADYSDVEIDRETALSAVDQARHFVAAIAAYVRNRAVVDKGSPP